MVIMRSVEWDKKEHEDEKFDGMRKRDPKNHEHNFDPITGICAICLKTREQLRKEW